MTQVHFTADMTLDYLPLNGLLNRFQAECLTARVRLNATNTIDELIAIATVHPPPPVQALVPQLPEYRALSAEAAARALVVAKEALFRIGAERDESFDEAVELFRRNVLLPLRSNFESQFRTIDAELGLLIGRRASIWGRL